MRLARLRRRSGFTLVEVLISMAIMASTLAIVWGSFSNSVRLKERASLKFDRNLAVQTALRRMQREISMAFVTRVGQIPTNQRGEQTYLTAFVGTQDRLDFTNFAHMRTRADEVASEQAEISYFLRSQRTEDGDLRQDLVRREQAPIDGDPQEGGRIYTLLEDVRSLEFGYWRPDREIAGDSWEPEWDTQQTGVSTLPPRVRITVEVPHPLAPRETQTFTVDTEIVLREPIGFEVAALTTEQLDQLDEETRRLLEEQMEEEERLRQEQEEQEAYDEQRRQRVEERRRRDDDEEGER